MSIAALKTASSVNKKAKHNKLRHIGSLFGVTLFMSSLVGSIYTLNKYQYMNKHPILKLFGMIPFCIGVPYMLDDGYIFDKLFVTIILMAQHIGFAYMTTKLFNKYSGLNIKLEYSLLWVYSSVFLVLNRELIGLNKRASTHDILFKYFVRIIWGYPFYISQKLDNILNKYILFNNNTLDYGTCKPVGTIIHDRIILGRFPMKNDISILYSNPYNVRMVINMCAELHGPINELNKYNIKYIYLPTTDTTEPDINDLEIGKHEIDNFIKLNSNNTNKIFIHCLAGKGRSTCMVLYWLISIGINKNDGYQLIKSKRNIDRVLHYNAINKCTLKYSDTF